METISHLVHDCLLLKGSPHARGHSELTSLRYILLEQSIAFREHCLLQFDSNNFTEFLCIE